MQKMDWVDDAVCTQADVNPDWWHPGTNNTTSEDVATALHLCAGCSVREECLESALGDVDTTFGIWGGTTFQQRQILFARRVLKGAAV